MASKPIWLFVLSIQNKNKSCQSKLHISIMCALLIYLVVWRYFFLVLNPLHLVQTLKYALWFFCNVILCNKYGKAQGKMTVCMLAPYSVSFLPLKLQFFLVLEARGLKWCVHFQWSIKYLWNAHRKANY